MTERTIPFALIAAELDRNYGDRGDKGTFGITHVVALGKGWLVTFHRSYKSSFPVARAQETRVAFFQSMSIETDHDSVSKCWDMIA